MTRTMPEPAPTLQPSVASFESAPQGRTPLRIFILHPSMILTDHLPSGDGLLAFEFVSRLARRGHQVHVAVSLQSIRGEVPPNLHLHQVNTRTKAFPTLVPPANRVEFALRAGALYRRVRRKYGVDVVHQLNPVVFGVALGAGIRNVPLVMGPIPPAWPPGAEFKVTLRRKLIEAVRAPMLRLQFSQATCVLPTSSKVLEQLGDDVLPAHKARMVPYGVDHEVFCPAEDAGLPAEPTVLFLANLWRRKGIFTLLDAFIEVNRVMPNARLLIAGQGSDKEEVYASVARHPAADRITLLGSVSRERVPEVLRDCTVFCLPSFGEPFGMSVLEAMSCGRAVVATNAGGLPDMVSPEGSILVQPGDDAALAQALLKVLADRQLAQTMGDANRQRTLEYFTWPAILDRLEGIYSSVL
jgi:glycosyltransferase involved in cell wall biosynthesis